MEKARFRNLLTDTDVSPRELRSLLCVASAVRRDRRCVRGMLSGRAIGLYFERSSLRTRVSSETACTLLGAHPVILRREELYLDRGESARNSAIVLSGYLDLIVGRVLRHSVLEDFASANALPVVNGLSNKWHPLQAFADALTISESFNGRLGGRIVTYCGDFNNVARSLSHTLVAAGCHVRVAAPAPYGVPKQEEEYLRGLGDQTGGTFNQFEELAEAVAGADVLYTDVWVSPGDEADAEARRRALAPYQINSDTVRRAAPHAIVLHCLPAQLGQEITSDVLEGAQSRVFRQAHNRYPAVVATLLFFLAREQFERLASLEEVAWR